MGPQDSTGLVTWTCSQTLQEMVLALGLTRPPFPSVEMRLPGCVVPQEAPGVCVGDVGWATDGNLMCGKSCWEGNSD